MSCLLDGAVFCTGNIRPARKSSTDSFTDAPEYPRKTTSNAYNGVLFTHCPVGIDPEEFHLRRTDWVKYRDLERCEELFQEVLRVKNEALDSLVLQLSEENYSEGSKERSLQSSSWWTVFNKKPQGSNTSTPKAVIGSPSRGEEDSEASTPRAVIASLSRLKVTISNRASETNTPEYKLKELQAQIEQLKSENEVVTNKVKDLEKTNQNLEEQYTELIIENEGLTNKVKDLEKTNQSLQEQYTKAMESVKQEALTVVKELQATILIQARSKERRHSLMAANDSGTPSPTSSAQPTARGVQGLRSARPSSSVSYPDIPTLDLRGIHNVGPSILGFTAVEDVRDGRGTLSKESEGIRSTTSLPATGATPREQRISLRASSFYFDQKLEDSAVEDSIRLWRDPRSARSRANLLDLVDGSDQAVASDVAVNEETKTKASNVFPVKESGLSQPAVISDDIRPNLQTNPSDLYSESSYSFAPSMGFMNKLMDSTGSTDRSLDKMPLEDVSDLYSLSSSSIAPSVPSMSDLVRDSAEQSLDKAPLVAHVVNPSDPSFVSVSSLSPSDWKMNESVRASREQSLDMQCPAGGRIEELDEIELSRKKNSADFSEAVSIMEQVTSFLDGLVTPRKSEHESTCTQAVPDPSCTQTVPEPEFFDAEPIPDEIIGFEVEVSPPSDSSGQQFFDVEQPSDAPAQVTGDVLKIADECHTDSVQPETLSKELSFNVNLEDTAAACDLVSEMQTSDEPTAVVEDDVASVSRKVNINQWLLGNDESKLIQYANDKPHECNDKTPPNPDNMPECSSNGIMAPYSNDSMFGGEVDIQTIGESSTAGVEVSERQIEHSLNLTEDNIKAMAAALSPRQDSLNSLNSLTGSDVSSFTYSTQASITSSTPSSVRRFRAASKEIMALSPEVEQARKAAREKRQNAKKEEARLLAKRNKEYRERLKNIASKSGPSTK